MKRYFHQVFYWTHVLHSVIHYSTAFIQDYPILGTQSTWDFLHGSITPTPSSSSSSRKNAYLHPSSTRRTRVSFRGLLTRRRSSLSSWIQNHEDEQNTSSSAALPTPPRKVRYNVFGTLGKVNNHTSDIGAYWSYQPAVQKTWNVTQQLITNDYTHDTSMTQHQEVENSTLGNTVMNSSIKYDFGVGKNIPVNAIQTNDNTGNMIVATDSEGKFLSRALWLYGENKDPTTTTTATTGDDDHTSTISSKEQQQPGEDEKIIRYEDIDTSLPPSVYNPDQGIDVVWTLMRQEAQREATREPLLVSFIYSTILNHPTLESALAFHLSNRLASPAMLSTQIMSLFQEAFSSSSSTSNLNQENDPPIQGTTITTTTTTTTTSTIGRTLRADILAVRDRDPACTCLPDVFLYFKGFHALQTHRVAHYLWRSGRKTLAYFFQSQMAQIFQIDIHPNARIGQGIMFDHGTGVVIGETAVLGDNCSVLHHVTLGGSGKKGKDRHPKIGKGVLLGAGSTVLGNIQVGDVRLDLLSFGSLTYVPHPMIMLFLIF